MTTSFKEWFAAGGEEFFITSIDDDTDLTEFQVPEIYDDDDDPDSECPLTSDRQDIVVEYIPECRTLETILEEDSDDVLSEGGQSIDGSICDVSERGFSQSRQISLHSANADDVTEFENMISSDELPQENQYNIDIINDDSSFGCHSKYIELHKEQGRLPIESDCSMISHGHDQSSVLGKSLLWSGDYISAEDEEIFECLPSIPCVLEENDSLDNRIERLTFDFEEEEQKTFDCTFSRPRPETMSSFSVSNASEANMNRYKSLHDLSRIGDPSYDDTPSWSYNHLPPFSSSCSSLRNDSQPINHCYRASKKMSSENLSDDSGYGDHLYHRCSSHEVASADETDQGYLENNFSSGRLTKSAPDLNTAAEFHRHRACLAKKMCESFLHEQSLRCYTSKSEEHQNCLHNKAIHKCSEVSNGISKEVSTACDSGSVDRFTCCKKRRSYRYNLYRSLMNAIHRNNCQSHALSMLHIDQFNYGLNRQQAYIRKIFEETSLGTQSNLDLYSSDSYSSDLLFSSTNHMNDEQQLGDEDVSTTNSTKEQLVIEKETSLRQSALEEESGDCEILLTNSESAYKIDYTCNASESDVCGNLVASNPTIEADTCGDECLSISSHQSSTAANKSKSFYKRAAEQLPSTSLSETGLDETPVSRINGVDKSEGIVPMIKDATAVATAVDISLPRAVGSADTTCLSSQQESTLDCQLLSSSSNGEDLRRSSKEANRLAMQVSVGIERPYKFCSHSCVTAKVISESGPRIWHSEDGIIAGSSSDDDPVKNENDSFYNRSRSFGPIKPDLPRKPVHLLKIGRNIKLKPAPPRVILHLKVSSSRELLDEVDLVPRSDGQEQVDGKYQLRLFDTQNSFCSEPSSSCVNSEDHIESDEIGSAYTREDNSSTVDSVGSRDTLPPRVSPRSSSVSATSVSKATKQYLSTASISNSDRITQTNRADAFIPSVNNGRLADRPKFHRQKAVHHDARPPPTDTESHLEKETLARVRPHCDRTCAQCADAVDIDRGCSHAANTVSLVANGQDDSAEREVTALGADSAAKTATGSREYTKTGLDSHNRVLGSSDWKNCASVVHRLTPEARRDDDTDVASIESLTELNHRSQLQTSCFSIGAVSHESLTSPGYRRPLQTRFPGVWRQEAGKTKSLAELQCGSRSDVSGGSVTCEDSMTTGLVSGKDVAARAKSLEFLLNASHKAATAPPENTLMQQNENRLSEHELRFLRSLQNLNVPDWYRRRSQAGALRKGLGSGPIVGGSWSGYTSKSNSRESLLSSQCTTPSATVPAPNCRSSASTPARACSRLFEWRSSRESIDRPTPAKPLLPTKQPYLGWRSQDRLHSTSSGYQSPSERLASNISRMRSDTTLNKPRGGATVKGVRRPPPDLDVHSSIRAVTSAIVDYFDGDTAQASPRRFRASSTASPSASTGGSGAWVETAFVGVRPTDQPNTPDGAATIPAPTGLAASLVTSQVTSDSTGHLPESRTTSASGQKTVPVSAFRRGSSVTMEEMLNSLLSLTPPIATTAKTTTRQSRSPSRRGISPSRIIYETSLVGNRPTAPTNNIADTTEISRRNDLTSSCSPDTHQSINCDKHHQWAPPSPPETSPRPTAITTVAWVSSSEPDSSCGGASSGDSLRVQPSSPLTERSLGLDSPPLSSSDTNGTRVRFKSGDWVDTNGERPVRGLEQLASTLPLMDDDLESDLELESADTDRSVVTTTPPADTDLSQIDDEEDGVPEDDPDSFFTVKCKNSLCLQTTRLTDAKKVFKMCHNCETYYCSRQCRRAHWERHKRVCSAIRAQTMAKQVIVKIRDDETLLVEFSREAQQGHANHGRGLLKVFFPSPESAENFLNRDSVSTSGALYIKWQDLLPREMGHTVYREIIKLCKGYNPDTKFVVYVAICVFNEILISGSSRWERQIIPRCAKLRIASSSQMASKSSASTLSPRNGRATEEMETLILFSLPNPRSEIPVERAREACFNNALRELRIRGISLRRDHPEVYNRLSNYAKKNHPLSPITIFPQDSVSNRRFMCLIMPEASSEQLMKIPRDCGRLKTVNIGIDFPYSHIER